MFIDQLIDRIRRLGTPLCLGLDPSLDLMPPVFLANRARDDAAACAEALHDYCLCVLEAAGDLVSVVKPQSAYFEMYGSHGVRALERTIVAAREHGLLVLLDAKRGDIGSTSDAYARAYLAGEPRRDIEVDAMTVAPYMGGDSLEPFFKTAQRWGKGVLVLGRTSNPGGAQLQDQQIGDRHVYEIIADWVGEWTEQSTGASGYSGLGLVVGATAEEQARRLRARLPRSLFLVPGMGAQAGSINAMRACFNEDKLGAIVSASRAAMYPHLYEKAVRGGVADIRNTVLRMIGELKLALA
jgi:orotidine-5'-phosphate decarboxylase